MLKHYSGNEKPLQSIGYKEVQDYLSKRILSQEDLISQIDISTRQLAKVQRIWFAKVEKIELSYPDFQVQAEKFIDTFLL